MTHVFVEKIRKYQEVLKSAFIYVVDVETTLISKDKYKTVYNTPPKYVCHGWVNCTNFDKPSILWNSGNLFDVFKIQKRELQLILTGVINFQIFKMGILLS